MDSYRVVDINEDGTLVGLRDQLGGNHIASLTVPTLQLDDLIDGDVARSGTQMFLSRNRMRIHRLQMLYVGCAQLQMLSHMHPMATAEPTHA